MSYQTDYTLNIIVYVYIYIYIYIYIYFLFLPLKYEHVCNVNSEIQTYISNVPSTYVMQYSLTQAHGSNLLYLEHMATVDISNVFCK